jgi:radical SAM/Cys-rich protein
VPSFVIGDMNQNLSSDIFPIKLEFSDQAQRFNDAILRHGGQLLKRAPLSELQINLGKLCNQACEHCHVDAGPKRTEVMSLDTTDRIIQWCDENSIQSVDITGGAPEMNPHFRYLVDQLLLLGAEIKVRCNLTVVFEPGMDDLPQWYADRGISLICSMPCYSKSNVDSQRGKGVFEKSIDALKLLNAAGYGANPQLSLDLVYNPGGAFLPPDQKTLEQEYKERFLNDHGIHFNQLFVLANLPINRFARYLRNNNQLDFYYDLLEQSFNAETLPGLMCRHLLSVDWLGNIFDCDFNQMLDVNLADSTAEKKLWDIDKASLEGQTIAVGDHCLGCTAGAGSSCGGSLVQD